MRGLTRRWILPPRVEIASRLGALRLPPLVERVLLARGLGDPDDVGRFCDPKLAHLEDPSALPGADAAAARLVEAVRADASIVIYGDYDVDGITATAILFHVIRAAAPGARLSSYVPHRLEEGYGLNEDAIRQIAAGGADLVVSVDCGITALGPARCARELGLDLIITDHHHLPAPDADGRVPLPDAMLVHPGLLRDAGSEGGAALDELCGAGVAYKLAWRFATSWCGSPRVSAPLRQALVDTLPLAALGTIADVVPLVGENRVLASVGLRLIKQTPIPGLRALIEASGLMNERIGCDDVGFRLGPRLNACGRMGHAAEAVRMLTDAPAAEAAAIARRLSEINGQRQQTERAVVEQATRLAEAAGMTGDDRRAIVLAHPEWHPGVVGIACSRLVEAFGRPAVLLERGAERCRGSARSIEGYSIHEALAACQGLLASFGGHDAAAGLALDAANLEAFTEALVAHANAHIAPEQLVPRLAIDADADLHELELPVVRRLMTLAPFGRGNRRPVVRVRGVHLAERPRTIGGGGQHLSLRLRQDRGGVRRIVRAVWWGRGGLADDLVAGTALDVAIVPTINEWNGRVSVEAEVRDVRKRDRETEDAYASAGTAAGDRVASPT